jgi:V8-like Glu-specific endopeptidase
MQQSERGEVAIGLIWVWGASRSVSAIPLTAGSERQHSILGQIGSWLSLTLGLWSGAGAALAAPPTRAISDTEISRLAKESTVKIASPTGVFSGTIVYRQNNTYTIITSASQFRAAPQQQYIVTSADNRVRTVGGVKFLGEKLDLAMFEFSSGRTYRVANLSKNIAAIKPGATVYISGFGYSNSTTIDPSKALFNITAGKLIQNSPKQLDNTGYSLVYDNATLTGQGGGAVWNDRGEVIGIHSDGALSNEIVPSTINPEIRQIKAKRKGISIETIRQILTKDRNFPGF